MRIKIKIFFFLAFCTCSFINGQTLHHQMLGAQGSAAKLESGYYVSQSIGQQSSTGNSFNTNYRIIQGFQQSAWAKLIAETVLPGKQTITVYPNPFVDMVGLYFGEPIEGAMQVLIFDTSGMLVVERNLELLNNSLQLPLSFLPPGIYLVHLRQKGFTSYVKILKK